jgi:hypothetical protein
MLKHDYRDFIAYPLNGHYLDLLVHKKGLGLTGKDNPRDLNVKATFDKYFHIGGPFYFASAFTLKYSLQDKQAFYLMDGPANGAEGLRGYEYYSFKGVNYVCSRSNFKYELLPPEYFSLDFIPSDRFNKPFFAFYLNVFFDATFVDNTIPYYTKKNDLMNQWLFAQGLGLDFVTYYDKVFRFEYSFNSIGQSGFFVHFVAPI